MTSKNISRKKNVRGEKERMKHENLSRAINCEALNKKF